MRIGMFLTYLKRIMDKKIFSAEILMISVNSFKKNKVFQWYLKKLTNNASFMSNFPTAMLFCGTLCLSRIYLNV